MATLWSIIANRMDGVSKVWTEWRLKLVSVSGGPADAGAIPMLNSSGQIDSSMLPGSSGATVVTTLTAGQTINAFQAVAVHPDGLAYLADDTSVADASQTIGLAITSATSGNPVQVQEVGFLSNAGWNWPTPGKTLFLGAAGTLTTAVPGGVLALPMGTVISNTEVELQIGLPIILA